MGDMNPSARRVVYILAIGALFGSRVGNAFTHRVLDSRNSNPSDYQLKACLLSEKKLRVSPLTLPA